MDFGLSDEQREFQALCRRFATEVIRPVAAKHDAEESTPWEVLKAARDWGLNGIDHLQRLAGDPDGQLNVIYAEELHWGCAGIALSISGSMLAAAGLAASGTPEQIARWIPECFGTGDEIKLGAYAVTEPQAGSDVKSLRTTAKPDGDEWVLNGTKVFITNGGIADVHVVVATVDPEAGHRGQGVFIVPKGTPGLSMLRKLDKLGCRASHTGEIMLEDCRVPGDQLLGGWERLQERIAKGREAEQGREPLTPEQESGAASAVQRRSSAALGAFERTRPMVAAQAIGIARAAIEFARDYAAHREAFGQAIIENQGVAFPLADLAAELDAARLLTWRAAWMAAQRKPFENAEGSMSKLKASELAVRASEQAIQTMGGWGYIKDFPVEKWYRDAKLYTIFEGTSEIQRLVIGRALRAQASADPLDQRMLSPR
jgi:acyl-CoA dehydrogenase